ncbi:Pr6Pr family membrane protein [Clostridium perfringens]
MFIKNKLISVLYKLIIIIICSYGIFIEIGIFDGKVNFKIFNYFTIWSNILVLLYLICSIVWIIKYNNTKKNNTFLPSLKGAITLNIVITFLVYNFILTKSNFDMKIANSYNMFIANKIVHYIVPVMMILDYLLFDNKGEYKKIYPVYWISIPYIYLFYVFIMIKLGNDVGINSKYPYPFLNIELLGNSKVFISIIYFNIAFILLGYLIFILDKLFSKGYYFFSKSKNVCFSKLK